VVFVVRLWRCTCDRTPMRKTRVPKGIYARLGSFSNTLYSLIVSGWESAGERVVISELCRRCHRGIKTVRGGLTEGRKLGWIRSFRNRSGAVVYTRHAPGPYVSVVMDDRVNPVRVAHKLLVLIQLNSEFKSANFGNKMLPYSRSSLYSALSELRNLGLLNGGEVVFEYLFEKSFKASPPKKRARQTRKKLSQEYDAWTSSGYPPLDGYEVDVAARIIIMHYRRLCLRVANVSFSPDSSRVADMKEILRWLSCEFPLDEDESQRLQRITEGRPYAVALAAVESLFTKYFSGFTYDFHVLFKLTDEKNYFDRFVLGTYLKAKKNPDWRVPLLRALQENTTDSRTESYDALKRRLLRNNS
jgi:hypothetical protein